MNHRTAAAATARAGLFVAMIALAIGGCEGLSAVSYAFQGGEPVKKLFQLPPKRTLVLVDTLEGPDQTNALATPSYRNLIASDIGYYLEKEEALPPDLIIDLRELNQLAGQLGDDYDRTPIDQIGRRLGAEQVIHVLIEQSSVAVAGNLYRPAAAGQVKVIDVRQAKRIFPRTMDLEAEGGGVPGHRFSVEMDPINQDVVSTTLTDMLSRQLAQQIALDVSRLFYDWRKPDLGSQIK